MLKKCLIISLFIVFLTGCEVDYKLEFNGDNLVENTSIILDSTHSQSDIEYLKKQTPFAIYDGLGTKEYNITFEEFNDSFKSNYNAEYFVSEYNRSNIINQCYDAVSFIAMDDGYMLSTSDEFLCMTYEYEKVDAVNVEITTNHKVIENNADNVENGVYTWKIDSSNAHNKPIKIVFGEVEVHKSFWDIIKEMDILHLFLIVTALLGGIAILIINAINKKNNRI